ncbi:bifunctional peptidase and arginyl-hydroxylase JMJD5 isoform X2 [Manis pentadactyla]|uniref:bifunctional peptidase and arginyl-hydroxylase JMJD5 isoform X2 n=1 Tax=Manis pentadactyla TaxID=143292 RepID=UPI00255CB77C|nr:bifunctional peptidase and arginyl-hydroxylase JMJD5 isoform X2 [Manis pentadactyla]
MAEDINRDPLAGRGTVWEALWALLPPSKDDLTLGLSERVERSMVMLLQRASDLLYRGRGHECLQTSEVILDYSWEKLNTGAWQDVDKDWRQVYAFGCLLKAVCLCEASSDRTTVAAALKVCDMGLLMGAAILGDILIKVAAVLQRHLLSGKRPAQGPTQEQPNIKKARNDHVSIPDVKSEGTVPRLYCPSLQYFRKHFLVPQRPVILEGVADHWPCMKKWSLEYIQEIAGCRTVPVEVGSRYTDEEWSQTLMTVSEFISRYIVNEPRDIGYLAQHQLFDQTEDQTHPRTERGSLLKVARQERWLFTSTAPGRCLQESAFGGREEEQYPAMWQICCPFFVGLSVILGVLYICSGYKLTREDFIPVINFPFCFLLLSQRR